MNLLVFFSRVAIPSRTSVVLSIAMSSRIDSRSLNCMWSSALSKLTLARFITSSRATYK